MLYYNGTNTKIETADGLIVKDGTQYQPYIAKTENADDEVDFGSADNVLKYYPQNAGITGTKETLTRETIGAKTPVKIAGSETYSGDMSLGSFTDTMPYMTSLLMRPEKNEVTSSIAALLYGNGTFTINDTVEQTDKTFRLAPHASVGRIDDIDVPLNFCCDGLSFKLDNMILDKGNVASDYFSYDDTYIKMATSTYNSIVPKEYVLNNPEFELKYNVYFKDKMPMYNTVKVNIIERSNMVCTDKTLTKEGSQNITASMVIYGTFILIYLTGADISNITDVSITAGEYIQDKIQYELMSFDDKKIIYISSDVTAKTTVNAEELVITLTGSDIVLKNKAEILFDGSNYNLGFKVIEKTSTKVATGKGLVWTTKDVDTSSDVILEETCKWSNFKQAFENIGNTQPLAPYLTDDCVCGMSVLILYGGGKYDCKGTNVLVFMGSEEISKKYGKYVYLFYPNTQDAITFNMLLQDTGAKNNERQDIQYVGCECKNLSFNFANKGLTEITSSITALRQISSKVSDVKVAKTEDRASVLVQSSNEPTTVYINCLDTRAITDATFTFEWTKEDSYNIKAEKLIKANSKYNWTFGGNAVYNKVSKDFIDRFNKGENISVVLQAQRTLNGKVNQIFIASLKATGVVSEPTIQQGDLTVALSEIVGDEIISNLGWNSNFIMIFSDDEFLFNED